MDLDDVMSLSFILWMSRDAWMLIETVLDLVLEIGRWKLWIVSTVDHDYHN